MSTKTKKLRTKKLLAALGIVVGGAIVTTSVLASTQMSSSQETTGTVTDTEYKSSQNTEEVKMTQSDQQDNPEQQVGTSKPNSSSQVEVASAAQPAQSTPQTAAQDRAAERAVSKKAKVSPLPVETLLIDEEFTGTALNESLWEVMTYPKAYRNNEEQSYRPSQVHVADGALHITAKRDEFGEWQSGEVHSKWAYKYGEFEVRLKVSETGKGVWPAAWLMGSTNHWPDNGEMDIFENINGSSTIHGTIHGGGANGHWQIQKSFSSVDVTQYHTYKIIKQPNVMSWWVDGVKRGEWRRSDTPPGGVWSFEDHEYFGLLNLAIGGNWPGPSDGTTPNPIVMSIDYFKVRAAL